jgi:hypothetical protein
MAELVQVGVGVLYGTLVATGLEGVRRRDVPAVVNALVSLVAALVPVVLVWHLPAGATDGLWPELPVWVATTGLLHTLGMLGRYESTWWWDHLTHTTSAALVAALCYAGLVVAHRQPSVVAPPGSAAGGTVLLVVVVGAFWELIEVAARAVGERYDIDPVLVHYGWRDTALDLAFNLLGTALVVGLDLRLFVPLAERFPRTAGLLVLGSAGAALAGCVLLAVGIMYVQRR